LTVTSEGEDLLRLVRPRILKNRKIALEGITEEEFVITRKVLEKIAENCS
jgi:DNA-binding MarR family transcriptional regulator